MTVTVIVASYNQPRTLSLVLEGLRRQSELDFEVVVADDGSDRDTFELLSSIQDLELRWVTQEDRGFRKARALNHGIREAQGDRLLFLDGDCIPPRHWVRSHCQALERADFSVAGYVFLDLSTTEKLSASDIRDGRFELLIPDATRRYFTRTHWKQRLYLLLGMKYRPKILGGNVAVRRSALERINGFDEHYDGFGKEDSDLRNRLRSAGCRGVSLWNSNWVFHCDHRVDARRVQPGALRRAPDRDYYYGQRDSARCIKGLIDERDGTRDD